jgi:hypothetical protein
MIETLFLVLLASLFSVTLTIVTTTKNIVNSEPMHVKYQRAHLLEGYGELQRAICAAFVREYRSR